MTYLTIGKSLDRTLAQVPESAIGQLTVGPLQLLSWLESQLGLELPDASFTARAVQYLACLAAADSAADGGARFYSKSLAQDALGTARTLLQWRDAWYEAGWTGDRFDAGPDDRSGHGADTDTDMGTDTAAEAQDSADVGTCRGSARLGDMADVERRARGAVPPGTGERVQRVLAALVALRSDAAPASADPAAGPLGIAATLLDPPAVFPKAWQHLFTALGATVAPLQPEPQAAADTDLGRLQRALIADRGPGRTIELAGDGTFIVLRDGSPQLSAPWIARFADRNNRADGSVAILAMQHGATLDDALADAGQPRLGFTEKSHWRPVFQVLPLTLELVWHPLDPLVLLQFLTHPMAPVPAGIRRPLADVVAGQPGIGGDDWIATVDEALDAAVASAPEDSRLARRDELSAGIDYWLGSERFDPETGAPIAVLTDRVRRVSRWLAGSFAAQQDESEAALYAAAIAQADELARTLERLGSAATGRAGSAGAERLGSTGAERLARVAVRRLVEAVRGAGVSRPGRPRQCAPGQPQMLRADSPAGFLEPVPTVIWWACDHEHLPGRHPWSRAEQAALARHGVGLVPVEAELRWQAASWLRPILAASGQLVLVLHDNADGHHPVFDEIVAVARGWIEARIDAVMREPAMLPDHGSLPATRGVPLQALPAKKRWWQLPENAALPPREQESFSSLEKFLFGPHRWVLDYAARVRPGALESIDDGPLLKGNLAHALFERYFETHDDIAALDPGRAARWARTETGRLIDQQGAVLLAPGRQAEREHLVATVGNALRELVGHLQAAGVVRVAMETELGGLFAGGAIRGTVDLIATKASGETAVLDLKWGGFVRRREMLVESNYLQLAIYAQLVHQNGGQWPALGYFIVSDARLAMLASDFFPGADVAVPGNGENILEFWQRVEQTWRWRRAQLDSGLVEVPVTGTEADEASAPGEGGLPVPETFDRYDDYRALTGWEIDE